jgi:hypothetical protein
MKHHQLTAFQFEVFLYGLSLLGSPLTLATHDNDDGTGINVALFSTAAFIILHQKAGLSKRPLLAAGLTMFLVSTTGVCLDCYAFFAVAVKGTPPPSAIGQAKHMLYLVNKCVFHPMLHT